MQITRRFTNQAGDLFSEFDRLFRNTVGRQADARVLPRDFSLYETDQSWILRTDLPGLRRENLTIEVADGLMSLRGSSDDELITTEIHQSLRLPKGIQVDAISARMEHGVLELVLPKAEPDSKKPIRIDVN